MSRSVLFTLLSRAIQLVCGFAGTVVTARFLGPDARGEYFFVVTLMLVIVQFANVGLQSSNTYYVARDEALIGPLVANSVWISVVFGAVGAAAIVELLRVTGWFTTQNPSLLWFTVALTPAVLFFMLGTNLLVGTQRLGVFNAVEAASNLGVTVALVLAGLAAFRVRGFLAVSSGVWMTSSLLLGVYLWRRGRASLRFRPDVFRSGLRYAFKAYLVTALGFFVLRANVFLVQHYYGSLDLGFYSVAAQVADAIAILPASVALVLFPRLVRDEADRWRATVRTTTFVAIALAGCCALAAALATPLMRVAFGDSFLPAATVLRLLLPAVFALGTTTVLSQFLASIGLPRLLIGVWMATLAIVLVAGRLLIPRHAGAGAAAALSIAYAGLLVMVATLAYIHRPRASLPAHELTVPTSDLPELHGGAT